MNNWINVKDRLPDVPERCSMDIIIYFNGRVTQGAYSGDGQWFQFAGFSHYAPRIHMILGDQIGSQNVYNIPSHLITHWMPLPDAPKENK